MLEETRDRFRSFAKIKIQCPLCDSYAVEYEFVLNRAAFSLCADCQLLFNSRAANGPMPTEIIDQTPIAEIRALVSKIRNESGKDAVIIASTAIADIASVQIREASSLKSDERFDVVIVLGGVPGDDPIETLTELQKHVADRGCMLFMLPSTASKTAKSSRANWLPLRSPARYFFCPDTLQLVATQAGLGHFLPFTDARDLTSNPSKALTSWFRSNFIMVAEPVPRESRRLLSVIFPVFNEARTVVESLTRVVEKQIAGVEIEVIVVESNSTDGSRQLIERFRDHDRVLIVLEDRPRGKGFAVRTGLAHARGEVVLFQDADLEYDVDDYDALIAPLFEMRRNFVLGSRHNPRGASWKIREFADQPLVATVANLAHVVLLEMFNRLYKQRLIDPFTMYKVFRRDCLQGLTFECDRFDFDFEINIMLLRKGYQPLEIPINYNSRSFSEGKKVSFFGDPPTWIRAMLKLRRSPLYRVSDAAFSTGHTRH